MPRGRPTPAVVLDPATRVALAQAHANSLLPDDYRRRCAIVILRASGMSIVAIARAVGMHRRHVADWLRRFRAAGLPGLRRKRRTGGRYGRRMVHP